MLTVLACVRTPDAARTIAVCADRLGVGGSVRTATTAVEAIARLAERPADLIFVDGPMTRPDPVGFVRRAMAYSPRATLVVYGLPEPSVASALISAGARGVIRGGDTDLVTAVTKTVLLLGIGEAPGAARERRPAGVAAAGAERARAIVSGKVNGGAGRGADIRNGGPSFAGGPRPAAAETGAGVPALAGVSGRTREAEARGGLPPSLVPQQRMDLPRPAGMRSPALTERELQVLRGMSDGKSNAEIGRELFVSEDTVKTHARRLFRKLGARDRAHAVASGFRLGLVG